MPIIDRFAKSECNNSCLHNEVPRTPQPTIAILLSDDVVDVELLGEELDGDDEKASTKTQILDDNNSSVDMNRRDRG